MNARATNAKSGRAGCGCLTFIVGVVALVIIIGVISGGSKSKPLKTESAAMKYLINNLPGTSPFSSATWHGLCEQDSDGWACYTQQTGYSNESSDRCQVLFICYRYPVKYWAMSKTGGDIHGISQIEYASRAL